jgi:glycosyltransferase involved in cell wall biosynthesis
MKSFAIILLSNGTFGGAQRRFTNLFLEFRLRRRLNAYFIVTPSMKRQIAEIYGDQALDGILTIGDDVPLLDTSAFVSPPLSKSKIAGPKRALLKQSIVYKIYYYFKTKRIQFKQFKEINHLAKKHEIDRFLAVYTGVLPLYFYLNRHKNRPRIVFSNMDSWFSHLSEAPEKDWFRQYDLFNRAHAECDMVDVLSPFIVEGLMKRGINLPATKYSITACSFIDYSRCSAGNKDKLSVVYAARLEKDKNPLDFVNAALQLASEFPDVDFHIAGDGRLAQDIQRLVKAKSPTNVIFHGFIENPMTLFAESSLFVSLQTANNYPSQAVLEAMACGNAIVATDVGDTRMFINDENGYLIGSGLTELSSALRMCLQRPEIIKQKGKFASQFVRENFTINKAANYYLNLIYPTNEA